MQNEVGVVSVTMPLIPEMDAGLVELGSRKSWMVAMVEIKKWFAGGDPAAP
jgi:hypothetical protein